MRNFSLIISLFSFLLLSQSYAADPASAPAPGAPRTRIFGKSVPIIHRWIVQLAAEDPAKADQAAMKIFVLGPVVVDELMSICESDAPFHGECMASEIDATAPRKLTVGYVALFLIRSAITGENPNRCRFLSPIDTSAHAAAKIYQEWYQAVLEKKEELFAIDKFLKGKGVSWPAN